MTTETVSFETILLPEMETPKAWCVMGGTWLPKSLVTIDQVIEEYEEALHVKGIKKLTTVQCVRITMPKWLAKK